VYNSGNKYEGKYSNGQEHGWGVYTYVSDTIGSSNKKDCRKERRLYNNGHLIKTEPFF
jgi:hypothetical protein